MRTRAGLLLVVLAWTEPLEYTRPAPEVIEVVKGICCSMSKPYGDVGLDSNSAAVVTDEGILVFDANLRRSPDTAPGRPRNPAAALARASALATRCCFYQQRRSSTAETSS
jgi:hypothetical protein